MKVRLRHTRHHAATGTRPILAATFACMVAPALANAFAASVDPAALRSEFRAGAADGIERAQIHCLALNVYHEARGEREEGKFAVAMVTLNRVRSPEFPNTVCRVVWQPGQFSWTHDGRSDLPRDEAAWKDALWVATVAYEFDPMSPVGDSTYFHKTRVRPEWAKTKRKIGRIGRHVFYSSG